MQIKLKVWSTYCTEGNFRKIFVVFVVEGLTTNILPTNEVTLLTSTCSASSNHEHITHENNVSILLNHEYFVPRKLPAIQ